MLAGFITPNVHQHLRRSAGFMRTLRLLVCVRLCARACVCALLRWHTLQTSRLEFVSAAGLRVDGRRPREVRRVRCRLGLFARVDGSAYFEQVGWQAPDGRACVSMVVFCTAAPQTRTLPR
jgi:hypothetical protein